MPSWTYDVRVVGEVDDELLSTMKSEFGSVDAILEPPSTLVRSTMPDQAGLIGMLLRLHDLGLKVYEVRRELGQSCDTERPGPSDD